MSAIAGFAHARIVERESKKAASLYAQFPSGDHVALLVKLKDKSVTVDIKASVAAHARAIAADLAHMAL